MNIALLSGVISSEIRRIEMQNGGSVTKFRIKTTDQFRMDGELKERSQTHLIDVWSPYLQRDITPFLKEGQQIEITGSIESRNIAKEGQPASWTTSIVLRANGSINIVGGPKSNTSVHADAAEGASDRPAKPNVDHRPRQPAPIAMPDDGLDDDVPF